MEKCTTRVLYGFATCLFLFLYSVEVLSAPTDQPSILDVIHADQQLKDVPKYLYDSVFLKSCNQYDYPTHTALAEFMPFDVFLCLGMHDAFYKISQYSKQWNNQFNSSVTFNAHIARFFPEKNKDEKGKFCEQLKDISPLYEPTKPLISKVMKQFDSPCTCYVGCFSVTDEFNPLCGILAWVKTLDQNEGQSQQEKGSSPIMQTMDKTTGQESTGIIRGANLVKAASEENAQANAEQPSAKHKADTESEKGVNPIESTDKKDKSTVQNDADKPLDLPKLKEPQVEANADTHALPNVESKQKAPTGPEKPLADERTDQIQDPKNEEKNANNAAAMDRAPMNTNANQYKAPDNTNTSAQNTQPKEKDSEHEGPSDTNPKTPNDDSKAYTVAEDTQDHDNVNPVYNDLLSLEPDENADQPPDIGKQSPNMPESSQQRDNLPHYHLRPEEESYAFTYFTIISVVFILGYIGYHHKQKILAIVLEGRRSRNNRGRRRPSTANYRKLDCTLEEAVKSQCNANVTPVLY